LAVIHHLSDAECQRLVNAARGRTAEAFQLWKLKANPVRTATLICKDGAGGAIFDSAIAYTDFQLAEITFYLTSETILPRSEY
jgi:hypothetical protein